LFFIYFNQKIEILNMLLEVQLTKEFSINEINLYTQLVEGIYLFHIFVINKQNDILILKKKKVVN